jgi:hypothetical protein
MISKDLVGSRIRRVRTTQRKTLKDVEAASGFSSTHISEIERGRTSPTIGALIRIAHALDKDPSFFIEERELEEVCVTSTGERPAPVPGLEFSGTGVHLEGLTRGVLGGRLLAYELRIDGGAEAAPSRVPETGDLCFICLEGRCQLETRDRTWPFDEGDSIHLTVDEMGVRLRGERAARVLVIVDPRETMAS